MKYLLYVILDFTANIVAYITNPAANGKGAWCVHYEKPWCRRKKSKKITWPEG